MISRYMLLKYLVISLLILALYITLASDLITQDKTVKEIITFFIVAVIVWLLNRDNPCLNEFIPCFEN